jgi:hypothetical protein
MLSDMAQRSDSKARMITADSIAHISRVAGITDTAAQFIREFMGRFRDEIVASGYREGCAIAPIVIESTPASTPLSDITRRGFGDIIAALTARLVEENLPPEHAHDLASLAVTTVQGALILSRTLRTPNRSTPPSPYRPPAHRPWPRRRNSDRTTGIRQESK